MKKITIFSFLTFIICSAFQPYKFQKNAMRNIVLSDYRDVYVGVYFCSKKSKRGLAGPQMSISTDTASLIITKDATDSILKINMAGKISKVKLLTTTLQAYPSNGHYGGRFYASDSINFYFAQGGAISYRYTGKKN